MFRNLLLACILLLVPGFFVSGAGSPPGLPASECSDLPAIHVILEEAISVGAPTYNEGNHVGCYRIYEGAAYKVLYKYKACKKVKSILAAALERSYSDNTATEKAWIMRRAFDTILENGSPK